MKASTPRPTPLKGEAPWPSRLIDRIGTLLRADAHGMMDALEEDGLLLKQHLRDAELELFQKRARVAALVEEEARLRDDYERRVKVVVALDQDVAMALEGEEEELARFAVRRLLPERRELQALGELVEDVAASREKLAQRLLEQERTFEDLKGRARAHLARAGRRAESELGDFEAGVADEEIELELLRRRGALAGGAA